MKAFHSMSISILNFRYWLMAVLILVTCVPGQAREFLFKRQPIHKVEIKGNRAFSDDKIKSFLFTKANSWLNILSKRRVSLSNITYDLKQIERFYARNGFLFAKADYQVNYAENDSSEVIVKFMVAENKRVYTEAVKVAGGIADINESIDKYIRKIKVDEPVNDDAVRTAVFMIKNVYAENAYPVADVTSDYQFSADSARVVVEFTIIPNEYVLNGQVKIIKETGGITKNFVIMRELLIKPGQPYDKSKVIESQQRLYATGLLKFVTLRRSLELYSRPR
jgi:outer membrane protein insertion porin family